MKLVNFDILLEKCVCFSFPPSRSRSDRSVEMKRGTNKRKKRGREETSRKTKRKRTPILCLVSPFFFSICKVTQIRPEPRAAGRGRARRGSGRGSRDRDNKNKSRPVHAGPGEGLSPPFFRRKWRLVARKSRPPAAQAVKYSTTVLYSIVLCQSRKRKTLNLL